MILDFAGLSLPVLCAGSICCGSLPASSLEYWWPPHYFCMPRKHHVATLCTSIWRGILLISYTPILVLTNLSMFFTDLGFIFLMSRKRGFHCWWHLPSSREPLLVLWLTWLLSLTQGSFLIFNWIIICFYCWSCVLYMLCVWFLVIGHVVCFVFSYVFGENV